MQDKRDIRLEEVAQLEDSCRLFRMLLDIMATLRSEHGCMWDREQNHQSLKKNLIEETYEAVESIEKKDMAGLKEELGDLLLQVVFHSRIGSENSDFDINDVLKTIISKLVRRHPHVFGSQKVKDSEEILANWEEIKKRERKQKKKESDSIFSNIPSILPALHYAYEIQRRAARLGFDWDSAAEVFDKIKEETLELKKVLKLGDLEATKQEIGDLLFSAVNLSRKLGIDCEESLKLTCKKFIDRFDLMEKYAEKKNLEFKDLPLGEKEKLWQKAKQELL